MNPHSIPKTTIQRLIQQYDVLLLDAYGVLVNQKESLPGAIDFIQHLNKIEKPYLILTNGSSSPIPKMALRYQQKGLSISESQIISSGSLIKQWITEHKLNGSHCLVIGPKSSYPLVEEAGCHIVGLNDFENKKQHIDIITITNQTGFPFLHTIEKVISFLHDRFKHNQHVHLLLPNPDLIFQSNTTTIQLTAGSIAHLIETALQTCFPNTPIKFQKLGKPHPLIFKEAKKRYPTSSMVMIGDQLQTDIKGALDSDIHSALVNTGLSSQGHLNSKHTIRPHYLLNSIHL